MSTPESLPVSTESLPISTAAEPQEQIQPPCAPAPDAGQDNEIGILKRREIEAKIIAPIYRILVREVGLEKAKEIIAEAVVADAHKNGQEFAKREPNGTSMKTFISLQSLWEKDDALVTDVIRGDEEKYDYNVTRCRYAEMYQELGLADIGHLLSCRRDYEFPTAYDPNISLERTTTIMEGHAVCDFRYTYNDPAAS